MSTDQTTPAAVPHSSNLRLRMSKVDEYQFLTCVNNSLWGSNSSRFKGWQIGDLLLIFVDKYLAGLGRISGTAFKSAEPVWDNGVFPHRISVDFEIVLLPDHRPPILGPVRDALAAAFPAGGYGLGILNQLLVPRGAAELIVDAMEKATNDLEYVKTHMPDLLTQAEALRVSFNPTLGTTHPVEAPTVVSSTATAEELTKDQESVHSKIQFQLIQLGLICGCSVWIASNDKTRIYKGKPLGEACLKLLPNLGLSPDASKRMSLIDVIWLQHNTPIYAFEVEATTSIYSGLLRMSDLLASVPVLKLQLFIVAPQARKASVLSELGRPTFDRIGLSDYCSYVPAEALDELESKVSTLKGHIRPDVILTLKIDAKAETPSSLE